MWANLRLFGDFSLLNYSYEAAQLCGWLCLCALPSNCPLSKCGSHQGVVHRGNWFHWSCLERTRGFLISSLTVLQPVALTGWFTLELWFRSRLCCPLTSKHAATTCLLAFSHLQSGRGNNSVHFTGLVARWWNEWLFLTELSTVGAKCVLSHILVSRVTCV